MNEYELRLGNLLQDGISKAVLIVCKIEVGVITTIVKDRNKYPLANGWYQEPIPLTEEWLVRFGLKLKPNHTAFHIGGMQFEIPSMIGGYYDNEYGLDERSKIELKSVHQLQNLYFALTGEELKLTEK